jgi:hypothetical protein
VILLVWYLLNILDQAQDRGSTDKQSEGLSAGAPSDQQRCQHTVYAHVPKAVVFRGVAMMLPYLQLLMNWHKVCECDPVERNPLDR